MKKSFQNPLRKLLALTALLVLLAALMCGCDNKNPTDETINNLPGATETQESTEEPTAPPTEEPTTPPEDVIIGTVTTDNLNIRSNPSTDSTVITQLKVSTQVQIFERKTVNGVPWGRIEQGWINLNYVAIEGEDPVEPTEPQQPTEPSTGSSEPEEPTDGTTGVVTADSLNIREDAGSKYDMVGKYYKGDKVTILATKNGWGKTDKGWISLNYVKLNGSAGSSSTGSSGSNSTGSATITAEALYIREGAGSKYDAVGKYYKGDKVTILETKDGWGKTDKGWISMKYVSTSGSTGSSSSSETTVKNFTGAGTITAGELNIREGAGTKYDKVGSYKKGDKVTILESKNGWGKTDKGWISLNYVKPDAQTGTITASSLHIREGAGSSYDSIGSYEKGDKVTILDTKDGWGKTDKGWISLKYVDLDD